METINFLSVSTEGALELPVKVNSQSVYSASNKMQVKEFANAWMAFAVFKVRFKMKRNRAVAIIRIDYDNRYKTIQMDVNVNLVNNIIQALSGSLPIKEIKEFLAKEAADENEESFTNIGEELFRLSVQQQRKPEEASDFVTEDGTVYKQYVSRFMRGNQIDYCIKLTDEFNAFLVENKMINTVDLFK